MGAIWNCWSIVKFDSLQFQRYQTITFIHYSHKEH
nr:MAG TPA: hypothetical protein [Caudoviricetes sp.]